MSRLGIVFAVMAVLAAHAAVAGPYGRDRALDQPPGAAHPDVYPGGATHELRLAERASPYTFRTPDGGVACRATDAEVICSNTRQTFECRAGVCSLRTGNYSFGHAQLPMVEPGLLLVTGQALKCLALERVVACLRPDGSIFRFSNFGFEESPDLIEAADFVVEPPRP